MAAKKYLVRIGFVVVLELVKAGSKGETYTRSYEGGEEVTLDDEQAELHKHKLEFASAKDRDAALAIEKEAKVTQAAQNSPVELVQTLVAALGALQAAAAPAVTDPA